MTKNILVATTFAAGYIILTVTVLHRPYKLGIIKNKPRLTSQRHGAFLISKKQSKKIPT